MDSSKSRLIGHKLVVPLLIKIVSESDRSVISCSCRSRGTVYRLNDFDRSAIDTVLEGIDPRVVVAGLDFDGFAASDEIVVFAEGAGVLRSEIGGVADGAVADDVGEVVELEDVGLTYGFDGVGAGSIDGCAVFSDNYGADASTVLAGFECARRRDGSDG